MDQLRVNMIMAVIGENTRRAKEKDLEHMSMMMEIDTPGNGCRVTNTGMEFSNGQVVQSIMDNGNMIK